MSENKNFTNPYPHKADRRKLARQKQLRRRLTVVAAIALMICLISAATLAFISTKTEKVDNSFRSGEVTNQVEESFDGTTKTDVSVKNTGNTDSYIRAQILVTWMSSDGKKVYAGRPVEGTDYTISYGNLGNEGDWIKSSDGFYYYSSPVAANASTSILIKEAKVKEGASVPEGYRLSVEIVASSIQASPVKAVTESWSSGVSSVDDNGLLSIKQ